MSADVVASHYNAVRQDGIGIRTQSRIYYMRNLNNWVKSQLINEVMELIIKETGVRRPRVMDLACGKGGDLRKWKIAHVDSLVMADVAAVSVEQAKGRYEEMKERERGNLFPAQFLVADCSKVDIAPLFDNSTPFDLTSCQFALHYSFVDEASARRFLLNATQSLKPGGYFIGTLPDADRIVWAARQQADGTFSNAVCKVRYDETDELSHPPLFGAMFHFELDSQVNCPEFLAYFPLLVKMMEDIDMELVFMRKFPDAISKWREDNNARGLMGRMEALEPFPPEEGIRLVGDEAEYAEAKKYAAGIDPNHKQSLGTLSKSEWEAVCMYLVFAFRKKGKVPEKEREAETVAETRPSLKRAHEEDESETERKCPATHPTSSSSSSLTEGNISKEKIEVDQTLIDDRNDDTTPATINEEK